MAVLGVAALIGLRGYLWVRAGEMWKAALLLACRGSRLSSPMAGWAWWRITKARSRVYDPLLIKEKVARIAFSAELQVTAVLPPGGTAERAKGLLNSVAAAYRHYDHPAGAQVQGGKGSVQSPSPTRPCTTREEGSSGIAACWECARRPPCGIRRGSATRRPSWQGPARGRSSRRRRALGEERPSGRPRRESPGRFASRTTCSSGTTSTSRGREWESPPSCSTS